MFKSISYYNNIAKDFLTESNKTFSKAILNESLEGKTKYKNENAVDEFDIFLSHSFLDHITIYGIYKDFESLGYKTYVDWIIDPTLDRNNITKATAKKIRDRMGQSKCLMYATSSNIDGSKWMPWELGYMDGLKKSKVLVFPLKEDDIDEDASIQLPIYLELYYSCSKEPERTTGEEILWVNETHDIYINFNSWLYENHKPFKRT